MNSNIALETLFEQFPGFQALPPVGRDKIVQQANAVTANRGQLLFQRGSSCQNLDLVLSGSVRVFIPGGNGREVLLYRVDPGELCVLSCSCLLGHTAYPASGIAETHLVAVRLTQTLFNELLEYPSFRTYVFQLFSDRLQSLLLLVQAVTFLRLDQRLAALLLEKGETINITHQQLADELGSVREIISRLLRQFADRGWLKLSRERIEILDRPALSNVAGDDRGIS